MSSLLHPSGQVSGRTRVSPEILALAEHSTEVLAYLEELAKQRPEARRLLLNIAETRLDLEREIQ